MTFSDREGVSHVAFGEDGGAYTVGVTFTVAEASTYTANATVQDASVCASELDLMSQVLAGPLGAINFSESSSSCDGCTDWWTSSQSGFYCL